MDITITTPLIPSEPPDKNNHMDVEKTTPHSYKEMLLDKPVSHQNDYNVEDASTIIKDDKGKNIEGSIALSQDDKKRLCFPWRYSVIIKVIGRRMPYQYLQSKLIDFWKPSEKLILIDLGLDFFIVKFSLEKNMAKALHLGPWFVSGNLLSLRKWEPNFVPQEATLSTIAIWICLPQLPKEFYDKEILEKVGRKLGK
ncbi:PREDICTED: uncharacterized protein LOC109213040 [Nicotiana attenuata]|uniref:uncharacterized protein LOC109213040 n=1 Tax=Nicotiana attenuata TaxID=49451 RepID=UPI000905837E|nr:PREDICTED: uncharacterized protein LOC109213040 [Nicotiana attenuata]